MFDHLVYLVDDLAATVTEFARLGIPPSPGGRHLSRGTHNALLRLGHRQYLELLALDPHSDVPSPRWMGIDVGHLPCISRWAASAGKIPDRQPVQSGQRELPNGQTLSWKLTDPGVEPAVSVLPFLIDWGTDGPHPADDLPDLGLYLAEFRLIHPDPAAIDGDLQRMGLPQRAIRGPGPKIEAVIRGPEIELML
ncbi:VOC family protein [Lewinella sp. IMCC34191]|uniref:VOC family protein n=1 Tax=Lewinella sp. IMCC34191 TaxID=2259172 RepID=UPI000E24F9FC|nr:VOC family protein [Lewinella sp. IMCC34191]